MSPYSIATLAIGRGSFRRLSIAGAYFSAAAVLRAVAVFGEVDGVEVWIEVGVEVWVRDDVGFEVEVDVEVWVRGNVGFEVWVEAGVEVWVRRDARRFAFVVMRSLW